MYLQRLLKQGRVLKPSWTNLHKSVKRTKKAKRAAKVNAQKSHLNADFNKYTQSKAEVDKTIYKVKQDYEDSLVYQIQTDQKKNTTTPSTLQGLSLTVEVLEHER